jgi:nitrogen regulatory protein PII
MPKLGGGLTGSVRNIVNRLTEGITGRQHEVEAGPRTFKIVFFIVDWNRVRNLGDVFTAKRVRFHFIVKGRGTASSDILDLLGLGASDKAVLLCLEESGMVPALLQDVRQSLGSQGAGAGIAFSVPLSGLNTPIIKAFENGNTVTNGGHKVNRNEHEEKPEKIEINNDLILAIINRGFADELMATAKEAGAGGGTVINARGIAHDGTVKFFGVSVQEEREVVLILTKREKKDAIMQAVCEKHGLSSKAEGLVFSLPVDKVMSLNLLAQ